jgi:hypothetical protein
MINGEGLTETHGQEEEEAQGSHGDLELTHA